LSLVFLNQLRGGEPAEYHQNGYFLSSTTCRDEVLMKKSVLVFLLALQFAIPASIVNNAQADWYRRSDGPDAHSTESNQEQDIKTQESDQVPPDEPAPAHEEQGSPEQPQEEAEPQDYDQQTDEIFEQPENQEPAK
jgi:hypothetical protein